MIEREESEVLERYECVLALDPRWSGPWVQIAEGTPSIATTLRRFNGGTRGSAYVFAPGAVDVDAVAGFLTNVHAAGEGGPYGGLAVVSDRFIFHTNWELVEAYEWRFVLARLQDRGLPHFVEVFGTTGMELEFTRRDDVLTIQHVDHEQPDGIRGSRQRLPRVALRDPARFAAGVESTVALVDALDARCGYWTGAPEP